MLPLLTPLLLLLLLLCSSYDSHLQGAERQLFLLGVCLRSGAPETYKCEYERTLCLMQSEATRKPPTSTLHEFKAHLVAARLGTVPSTEGGCSKYKPPRDKIPSTFHSLHLITSVNQIHILHAT